MSKDTADRKFYFSLSERCRINRLKNSNYVEFDIENNNCDYFLKGFWILEKNRVESVGRFDATQKAIVLSNYISVTYGKYTCPSLMGVSEDNKDGTWRVSKSVRTRYIHIKELDFDLNDPQLSSVFSDQDKNIKYEHASRGIKAAQEEDPVTMIKEFYQVIENSEPPHLVRFKFLRHILSHKGPIYTSTIKDLGSGFGNGYFTFTLNNDFDYTSPTNIDHLVQQAKILQNEVLAMLQ
jgi:hypothetical protein